MGFEPRLRHTPVLLPGRAAAGRAGRMRAARMVRRMGLGEVERGEKIRIGADRVNGSPRAGGTLLSGTHNSGWRVMFMELLDRASLAALRPHRAAPSPDASYRCLPPLSPPRIENGGGGRVRCSSPLARPSST